MRLKLMDINKHTCMNMINQTYKILLNYTHLKLIIQYVFPRKVMLFISLRNPFSSGTD